MNTKEVIKNYLKQPVKIGDKVLIKGLNTSNKDEYKELVEVLKVLDDDTIQYKYYNMILYSDKEHYKKYIDDIGHNPFNNKNEECKCEYYFMTLVQFLTKIKTNANYNPFLIDKYNQKHYIQKGIDWSLTQKQDLIESIFKNRDIGIFLLRNRSNKFIMNNINIKRLSNIEIIDGVQRIYSNIEYINNEFKDYNGVYYKDLSNIAKKQFKNFNSMKIIELSQSTTDKQTQEIYLQYNFYPQYFDDETTEYIKSLEID